MYLQIASEPLTFEKGIYLPVRLNAANTTPLHLADWMEIKTNHMIVVTAKMNVLLIPIVDKFYVPPSDPAAQPRDIDLAVAKGYYSHPTQLPHT